MYCCFIVVGCDTWRPNTLSPASCRRPEQPSSRPTSSRYPLLSIIPIPPLLFIIRHRFTLPIDPLPPLHSRHPFPSQIIAWSGPILLFFLCHQEPSSMHAPIGRNKIPQIIVCCHLIRGSLSCLSVDGAFVDGIDTSLRFRRGFPLLRWRAWVGV